MYNTILWMQGFQSNFFTEFFKIFTNLVSPAVLCIFAVIIYWCFDKKKGLAVAFAIMTAATFNTALKLVFKIPRPYDKSFGIKRLDFSTEGYAFPSGHAQQMAAITTSTAYEYKRYKVGKQFILWGSVLTVMVCLSRMYLGMHTILDILVGILLGVLLSWATCYLLKLIVRVNKPALLYGFVLLFSAFALISGYDSEMNIFSNFNKELVTMAGISFGIVTGYIYDVKVIKYKPPVKPVMKVKVAMIGFAIIAALKYITWMILAEAWYCTLTEYIILGLAITVLVPSLARVLGFTDDYHIKKRKNHDEEYDEY